MTGDEYIVKTIVTSETIRKIAEKEGIKMFGCYTGLSGLLPLCVEMEGKGRYCGGGEEVTASCPRRLPADKDSVSSIPLMCEIAAWAKDKGMTLNDLFIDLYINYGYSKERGISSGVPAKRSRRGLPR